MSKVSRSFKRPPPSGEGNSPSKKTQRCNQIRVVELTRLEGGVVFAKITDESGLPAYMKPLVDALEAGELPDLQYLLKCSLRDGDGCIIFYFTRGSSPKRLPTQGIFFAAASESELLHKGTMLGNLLKAKVKPFRGGEFEVSIVPTQESGEDENFRKLSEVVGPYDTSTIVSQIFYDHLVEHGFENMEQELSQYYNYSDTLDMATVKRIIKYKFNETFGESVANPQI